jgi:hypothetical protein
MAERNIRFQVNQDDINVDNDDNDGNQDAPNLPQNVQAPQVVVLAGAPGVPQTTLAFKVLKIEAPRILRSERKGQHYGHHIHQED